LAAVLHINKNNAAGNSKRLYNPELDQCTCFMYSNKINTNNVSIENKFLWLRYNIAMRKQNTANKYSQPGRRKKHEVI